MPFENWKEIWRGIRAVARNPYDDINASNGGSGFSHDHDRKVSQIISGDIIGSFRDKDALKYEFNNIDPYDAQAQYDYMENLFIKDPQKFAAAVDHYNSDIKEVAQHILQREEAEMLLSKHLKEGYLDNDGIDYRVVSEPGISVFIEANISGERFYDTSNEEDEVLEVYDSPLVGQFEHLYNYSKDRLLKRDVLEEMEDYATSLNEEARFKPDNGEEIEVSVYVKDRGFIGTRLELANAVYSDVADIVKDSDIDIYEIAWGQGQYEDAEESEMSDKAIQQVLSKDPNAIDIARSHAKGIVSRSVYINEDRGEFMVTNSNGWGARTIHH